MLQAADAFRAAGGREAEHRDANQIVIAWGRVFWTSRRRVRVFAQDVPTGADVLVEAWIESWQVGEMNANPNEFVGSLVRPGLWKVAVELLAQLGVPQPATVLMHY